MPPEQRPLAACHTCPQSSARPLPATRVPRAAPSRCLPHVLPENSCQPPAHSIFWSSWSTLKNYYIFNACGWVWFSVTRWRQTSYICKFALGNSATNFWSCDSRVGISKVLVTPSEIFYIVPYVLLPMIAICTLSSISLFTLLLLFSLQHQPISTTLPIAILNGTWLFRDEGRRWMIFFSFFDCSIPFFMEFYCTFSISYKIQTNCVYYYYYYYFLKLKIRSIGMVCGRCYECLKLEDFFLKPCRVFI